jgi:hypothetical protein
MGHTAYYERKKWKFVFIIIIIIIITITIIMTLHPFVGPWPLSKFLNHIHSREGSVHGGSVRRKAATCTLDDTDRE